MIPRTSSLVLELTPVQSHLQGNSFQQYQNSAFSSSRYPLALGIQKLFGVRNLPDSSGIENQTSDPLILSRLPYLLMHMLANLVSGYAIPLTLKVLNF